MSDWQELHMRDFLWHWTLTHVWLWKFILLAITNKMEKSIVIIMVIKCVAVWTNLPVWNALVLLLLQLLVHGTSPVVEYEYTLAKVLDTPPVRVHHHNYRWTVAASQCSATCAGGQTLTAPHNFKYTFYAHFFSKKSSLFLLFIVLFLFYFFILYCCLCVCW